MSRTPEQRIRQLVGDLEPVRPIPRLRVLGAAAFGLAAVAALLEWVLGGSPPRTDGAWRQPGFLAVLLGLAATAAGAVGAALATATPGREGAARAGWMLAGLGGVLAVAALLSASASAGVEARGSLSVPWFCLGRTAWIGLLPALALAAFAARGAGFQPRRTALAGWLGALCLGAVVVQASCLAEGIWHVLLGHALGPVAMAVILTLPGAWWLRRRAAAV